MTAQEILDQIESYKNKKGKAEGRVQTLSEQLDALEVDFQTLVGTCEEKYGCKPKDLKKLMATKQSELEAKLQNIEEKLQELTGE
jgi:outer membrane murein-binding lipoprotein Lpp